MAQVTYEIVQHDGGWAYKLGDVFSEAFASRDEAERAARIVAVEQRVPGEKSVISYQDDRGVWHEEQSSGSDRPSTDISE